MKLFIQKDEGQMLEVKEVNSLDKESKVLFFFLDQHLRKEDVESIERELSTKIGRKCVILDSLFIPKIMGV